MGGSLGLAVKRKRLAETVVGFARRALTRRQALNQGVVDEVFGRLDLAVRDADLAVFCAPVGVIPELIRKCMSHFSEDCVVADVGSSKREIVSDLDPLFGRKGPFFVGCHPIAGSERNGLSAAVPDLYEKAVVVLTPTARTNPSAVKLLSGFWKGAGARVFRISPGEHDAYLGRTSHLPHIVAAALASHVGGNPVSFSGALCGSGFFDTTRIAEGDPALWRDIIMSNAGPIARELREFAKRTEMVRRMIEKGDTSGVLRFLATARVRRRELRGG